MNSRDRKRTVKNVQTLISAAILAARDGDPDLAEALMWMVEGRVQFMDRALGQSNADANILRGRLEHLQVETLALTGRVKAFFGAEDD